MFVSNAPHFRWCSHSALIGIGFVPFDTKVRFEPTLRANDWELLTLYPPSRERKEGQLSTIHPTRPPPKPFGKVSLGAGRRVPAAEGERPVSVQ
jgi:hypothetical protein